MIRLSCPIKLHAFQLAEQLDRFGTLDKFYTIYHTKKNTLTAKFNKRQDLEQIALQRIQTFPWLAAVTRLRKDPFANNALFDSMVAAKLKRNKNYRAFIGWSGISIKSITQAQADKKKVILERGSSHICFQSELLEDEYKRWGFQFKIDQRVIDQELVEYDRADYVTVPSSFVENTFLDRGFPREKIFKNNFGSSSLFKPTQPKRATFTIVYVGSLSLRKGLPYLFQALNLLTIDPDMFDVWFIGNISEEIKSLIPKYQKSNWKFFGHVNAMQLPDLISQCSVAVHPSLEEGLSMVIPQLMACGTPVIATTNTGGEDIIRDGESGYVIPIRSPQLISDRVARLFYNSQLLASMQQRAVEYAQYAGTWNQYGDRYNKIIKSLTSVE